jgi:hypothetical protein
MGYSALIAQSDSLRINTQKITTFSQGDVGKIDFPNELTTTAVDKQGNGLLAINQQGLLAELEVRLVMSQADDQYLNGLLAQTMAGTPTILSGVFTKVFADQNGAQTSVQIQLSGGSIRKGVPMTISADGNVEQLTAIWMLRYASWSRLII